MEIAAVIISIVALGFTLWTYYKHDKKIKQQEEQLYEYQIRKNKEDEGNSKKAVFELSITKVSDEKKTLKVENKGKSQARNVSIEMINDEHIRPETKKFPTIINAGSIAVSDFYSYKSPDSYLKVHIQWDDDFKEGNKEEKIVDLN